jgi:hemolysin D
MQKHKSQKYSREDAAFLPIALSLQESPASPLPGVVIVLISCMILSVFIWSYFGEIDVITVAEGSIVSEARLQVVQAAEAGQIKKIFVRDGDFVKAGLVLMELDTKSLDIEKRKITIELAEAKLALFRAQDVLATQESDNLVKAEIPEVPAIPEAQLLKSIALKQRDAQINEFRSKMHEIDEEVTRRQAQLQRSKNEIRRLGKAVEFSRKREKDFHELAEKKFVSNHALLEREENLINLEGELSSAELSQNEAASAIKLAQLNKVTYRSSARRELMSEIESNQKQIEILSQQLSGIDEQRERFTIRATSAGTVQQLSTHTIGGTVSLGQQICAIAPAGSKVEVLAQVENQDIGFVKVGQEVKLKVHAIDFTRYGTVPGRVDAISASSIQDSKNSSLYSVRISIANLDQQLSRLPSKLNQGMLVTAEIKTDERKIIQYLISPISKAVKESFHEQ